MKMIIPAALAALLISSTAFADPSVIFNGIDVTGVTNQHLPMLLSILMPTATFS